MRVRTELIPRWSTFDLVTFHMLSSKIESSLSTCCQYMWPGLCNSPSISHASATFEACGCRCLLKDVLEQIQDAGLKSKRNEPTNICVPAMNVYFRTANPCNGHDIGQKHNCRLTSSTEGRVNPCRSCWHEPQKKESNSLTSSLVRFTQLK
jgi:hypothetical protein